jgi:hypothetical protein
MRPLFFKGNNPLLASLLACLVSPVERLQIPGIAALAHLYSFGNCR